jgi:hypothetical protein
MHLSHVLGGKALEVQELQSSWDLLSSMLA